MSRPRHGYRCNPGRTARAPRGASTWIRSAPESLRRRPPDHRAQPVGDLLAAASARTGVALVGLVIIVLMLLMAIFAPMIAKVVADTDPTRSSCETLDDIGARRRRGPTKEAPVFGVDDTGRDLFVRIAVRGADVAHRRVPRDGHRGRARRAPRLARRLLPGQDRHGDLADHRRRAVAADPAARARDRVRVRRQPGGVSRGLHQPGLLLGQHDHRRCSRWPYIARIVRGQVLSLREKEFIEASRSLGCVEHAHHAPRDPARTWPRRSSSTRTLIIPSNILFEAGLSFLGVGVPDPTPSWGGMLVRRRHAFTLAPWLMVFPGLALFLTTLAFNLVGDGLRDALDPGRPSERIQTREEPGAKGGRRHRRHASCMECEHEEPEKGGSC